MTHRTLAEHLEAVEQRLYLARAKLRDVEPGDESFYLEKLLDTASAAVHEGMTTAATIAERVRDMAECLATKKDRIMTFDQDEYFKAVEPDKRVIDYDTDNESGEPDRTCQYCGGTGGDHANDGALPCPYCDGEGYRWWE